MIPSVTLKPLSWHPWIAPVELADATPEQLAAMQVTPSNKKVSEYVRTLAHDPESYVARTLLFNAIMYVEGGLDRADRELGALGASLVNGCKYCAVVHARRHAQLRKDNALVSALYYHREDQLGPRDAAIYRFARRLSVTPSEATPEDVAALREVGMNDREIIDLIHATAIFGWANRLMHVLGHAGVEK
ncbi:peroxidase-related enzyme [Erwinia sp. S43]|uniref:Alkylhydroperoxidase n=1 Tax=Pantoea coffeiphila TaxID=1465635 RepID=A0A2S9IEU7_9GAMM|nr:MULTISPECIES: peroxidase-related enzyme [Erwiniaceae]MBK0031133.1 peroxidase-related enzyme [Erwinia sp. S43]MBM7345125.1 putative peroxidase-related enzyme [Pantoea coffeiphila]MCW1872891.1 peroxidase-related enzyme [Erwinia sp. INIA01]PRD16298.1 alkylhydroperoxidase [Pantoea coffeiphila]